MLNRVYFLTLALWIARAEAKCYKGLDIDTLPDVRSFMSITDLMYILLTSSQRVVGADNDDRLVVSVWQRSVV